MAPRQRTRHQGASLPTRYNPALVESKWQEYWLRKEIYETAFKFQKDDLDRPVFVIDTPPPFTSGELHMGHAYWNVLNDSIARYKRMRGYNVLLPQGWDCQGLPTELKVQDRWLISKDDKELFREKCVEWTELMINSMKKTMTRLGYRPDWEQFEYRTMDQDYWRIVQTTLLTFFEQDLIYRSAFPVHWCPHCETALAQAELGYLEKQGILYYIRFYDDESYVEVATTRPELLPACQALAIHPDDTRYSKLVGKRVEIPLFHRKVHVLVDQDVDPEFGTGVVMICTFGDEQDIRWQQKHSLPIVKKVDERGQLLDSDKYSGLSVYDARTRIAEDLEAQGHLSKKEKIEHKVLCHTERADCLAPIEFLVKDQFFVTSKQFKDQVNTACAEMTWQPEYMNQRLIDWVNSIEWDWLISRQRLYGTPLPFWFCDDCNVIIPAKREQLPVDPTKTDPPLRVCEACGSSNIQACEDVCDCWVDSSITPLVISGYFSKEEYFSKAYPANLRQQGHDIIRTWLYYTTLRCLILTQKSPFLGVLINGHVLGPEGYSMSKSRGNVISPEDNIDELGADSLRQSLLSVTLGSDFSFNWELVKYSRSFLQKYWSALRFAYRFLKEYQGSVGDKKYLTTIDKWILHKLREVISNVTEHLERYQFHSAIQAIQNFVWHDFCDQYLEAVKYRLYNKAYEKTVRAAQYTLHTVLWNTTLLLAPICPHIAEEAYHSMWATKEAPTIHALRWPKEPEIPSDERAKAEGEIIVETLSKIRALKAREQIPLSQQVDGIIIQAPTAIQAILTRHADDVKNILHIQSIAFKETEIFKVALV